MPHSTDDIKAVHRDLRSWFQHKKRNGFSQAASNATTRVLCGLDAYQAQPHPTIKTGLVEDVEQLKKLTRRGEL